MLDWMHDAEVFLLYLDTLIRYPYCKHCITRLLDMERMIIRKLP
jgi:hypothetical protein